MGVRWGARLKDWSTIGIPLTGHNGKLKWSAMRSAIEVERDWVTSNVARRGTPVERDG